MIMCERCGKELTTDDSLVEIIISTVIDDDHKSLEGLDRRFCMDCYEEIIDYLLGEGML
jgi:hypothetical protein